MVGSHDVFTRFPYGYSYVAVAYFALFAWRSWMMQLLPPAARARHHR